MAGNRLALNTCAAAGLHYQLVDGIATQAVAMVLAGRVCMMALLRTLLQGAGRACMALQHMPVQWCWQGLYA